MKGARAWALSGVLILLCCAARLGAELPDDVRVVYGPVNSAAVGGDIAVYGGGALEAGEARWVLFTHARRDMVRASADALAGGATAVTPQGEDERFAAPEKFWTWWEAARFHDYSQVMTQAPRQAVARRRSVRGGDVLELDGVRVEVLDTPGYSPGSVSYLVETGGRRVAFSGDLIYGPGQILDLYSLQDAIPEAKVRGYHGYAARAADLIASLEKIAGRRPDVLVPAHGDVIDRPQEAVARLIGGLRELLHSHFRTDALRWYWGEENFRLRAGRVLGGELPEPMPGAEEAQLPGWAVAVGNSRLLVSRGGAGFLVDAGNDRVGPVIEEMLRGGRLKALEGIWVTHYHDDHTEHVAELAGKYRCPVYFIEQMRDVLERPSYYHLPCLTKKPIRGRALRNGTQWKWREFELTAHYFPGQTLYHGALLARRDDGQALYFVGDSFTPSGMDDYCMHNRNLLHEELGYGRCLRLLGSLPPGVGLVNQHVEPVFRFTPEQLLIMRAELEGRRAVTARLVPWPDPNYGVDASWAGVYPYGSEVKPDQVFTLEARIFNHSPIEETFHLGWNLPPGWRLLEADRRVIAKPRTETAGRARIQAGSAGLHVVTVDIAFRDRELLEWTEGLVRVTGPDGVRPAR